MKVSEYTRWRGTLPKSRTVPVVTVCVPEGKEAVKSTETGVSREVYQRKEQVGNTDGSIHC